MIPLAIPSMNGCETWHVLSALNAVELAAGPFVQRFEQVVADFTGARYAVAMSSGTAALHIALLTAGVGANDKVIVPATTFIATANAVRYCGAEPVILDVEPDTWGLAPNILAEYLKDHRVAAILPVHLYGTPCLRDSILGLAGRYGVPVVEDSAEALGARYKGLRLGSEGTHALSFNGNKLITTGGGGMLLTDNARVDEMARYLIGQAKLDDASLTYGSGFNYRMPNLNAALGYGQMESIDQRLEAKRAAHVFYEGALPGVFEPPMWCRSSCWLSAVHVRDAESAVVRLRDVGIDCRMVWRPLNQQPGLKDCAPYETPCAAALYREWLMLPSSVGITPEEQMRVIEALA